MVSGRFQDLLRAYPPGYNRQRMVYGEFCAAAGLVYPLFNAKDTSQAL